MIYIDLVMDNGELVRIEAPTKLEDEVWLAIENGMKRRDYFSPSRWDGVAATYLGLRLERVTMGRMIATL